MSSKSDHRPTIDSRGAGGRRGGDVDVAVDDEGPRRYRSADRMIERYHELMVAMGTPKALTLDPTHVFLPDRQGGSGIIARLQLELAEILRCIKLVKMTNQERAVLKRLYRPRRRYCKFCRKVWPQAENEPRCPKCQRGRRDGWTYEALPTGEVLAAELTRDTRVRWTSKYVREVRDAALVRIEAAMQKKGLLED